MFLLGSQNAVLAPIHFPDELEFWAILEVQLCYRLVTFMCNNNNHVRRWGATWNEVLMRSASWIRLTGLRIPALLFVVYVTMCRSLRFWASASSSVKWRQLFCIYERAFIGITMFHMDNIYHVKREKYLLGNAWLNSNYSWMGLFIADAFDMFIHNLNLQERNELHILI